MAGAMRGALPAAPGRFYANRSVDGPSPRYPRAAATPPKKLRRETSWLMDPPKKVDERNRVILARTRRAFAPSFDDRQNCRPGSWRGCMVRLETRRAQKCAQFRSIQVSVGLHLNVAKPGAVAQQDALRILEQRPAADPPDLPDATSCRRFRTTSDSPSRCRCRRCRAFCRR